MLIGIIEIGFNPFYRCDAAGKITYAFMMLLKARVLMIFGCTKNILKFDFFIKSRVL